MGLVSTEDVSRVARLLAVFNLPTKPPVIEVDTALDLMGHDKKVQAGKVRLVLLNGIGKGFVTADFDMVQLTNVLQGIDEYLA